MKILKQEKGSITLFVLISMLFFVMYLVGMYMLSASSESSQIAETARIKEIYEQGVDNIDDVYNSLIGENQKVNAPVYKGTGLTPVTISEDGTITAASTTTANWYSYDGTVNHWANAKTKDGSMWVWIPRYAYKITYTDASDKSAGGTIDVVFLKGTTNNDFNGNDVTSEEYVDENGKTGPYIVHPAFQDGTDNGFANGEWDEEIEGFWMAKFKAGYAGEVGQPNTAVDSNATYRSISSWMGNKTENYKNNYYYLNGGKEVGTAIKYPTFQANKACVNFIGIADAYKLCLDIKNGTNVYALTNIDSHMPKNSEWGAVVYLSYSKYGRDGEVIVPNDVNIVNATESLYAITGYGAASADVTDVDRSRTSLDTLMTPGQPGSWATEQGQTASTTGNMYGIYDISTIGTREWIAGYIEAGTFENYSYEEFKANNGESTEYKTKYEGTSSTASDNYSLNANQKRVGDAIMETSTDAEGYNSWNSEQSGFPNTTFPFFTRSNNGMFTFNRWGNEFCTYYIGFRAVLIVE